jgi:hypothetical protein
MEEHLKTSFLLKLTFTFTNPPANRYWKALYPATQRGKRLKEREGGGGEKSNDRKRDRFYTYLFQCIAILVANVYSSICSAQNYEKEADKILHRGIYYYEL